MDEVSQSHISSDGLLRDFCDGSIYKSHSIFASDQLALQIVPYYDELEICNPLGSYTKKHKVGMFYYTIANVHPKFRSSLKCIVLFAVAKSEDIKTFGTDPIVHQLVCDLNKISKDGLILETATFKGALLAFLGDNMGSHSIGGFKESMSFSYRFCRSCLTTQEQSRTIFTAGGFEARTPAEHKRHCALLSGPLKHHHSMVYGINRESALESAEHFSVSTGLPHDIMHDLLEGAFLYEVKALLLYCIDQKYFSVSTLNSQLRSFDFGYSESSNKPTPIDLVALKSRDGKIHQSASQMWLFARTLPLLVGDKVPSDDQHWHCFTLLLNILDICTQHECSEDSVACLSVLVEKHHTLFQDLYPDVHIKPKHHFMVHYPEQILKFGHLVNYWTMRHEAKLKLAKMVSRFGNFKNICLSIAEKHQRWFCYQLQSPRNAFLTTTPEVGGYSYTMHMHDEAVDIRQELNSLVSDDVLICHPSWVQHFNSTFKKFCVIVVSYGVFPTFGKVQDLMVLPGGEVVFYVTLYETLYFDDHYHAFVILPTANTKCVLLSTLQYSFVLHPYTNFNMDGNYYVVLKYGIDVKLLKE